MELTPKVPQRLLGTYIGVLHSSNLCACSSTNYRTVWMGVVVSGTNSKSTTEIAGDCSNLLHSSNLCACSSTKIGDYTLGVIIAAVTESGDQLHNLTANIRNFMQAHGSGHYLFSTPEILCNSIVTPGKQFPHMLLIKHVAYHYTCLQIHNNGSVWWLDSRKSEPVSLSLLHLHSILKKELTC